jgi:tripeptidyl-peptidase I
VAGYLEAASSDSKTPYTGYNSEGRAYPDVAIAGLGYLYYVGGAQSLFSGTAAAAPVVAGMFSNINAARLSVGKGSIGWVTPALYMNHTSYMHDITTGSNKCGGHNSAGGFSCCPQGFSAAPGWDPTTGLGSFHYQKMKKHFIFLGEIKSIHQHVRHRLL